MTFTLLDWIILAASLLLPLAIGVAVYRRAGANVGQFFLSGRDLPWWLAGTSMVATTFAADTPLAVTGLVAANGVAGNWLWWNAALGSLLTVFFFARLWRRAGVLTDMEFAELRYTGKVAALLRGLRAIYLGLPVNCLIIGWVNLAMGKILAITLGWNQRTAVFGSLALTGCYTALSGLRGVVLTDFVQFGLAWGGTVALALVALNLPAVNGVEGLRAALPSSTFRLLPVTGDAGEVAYRMALPLSAFVAYLGVQWWASWYPGQEPGGGGYVAQRMMSSRDERHSLLATLWFALAHYCVRPWPWIIVALASMVLYPGVADKEAGYVMVIRDHLPSGGRGLLIGAFFAAYMSTVSTQLNWGTSYLVHDVYRRFVRPDATETHLVRLSRVTTLALMGLSAWITVYLESVRQAWEFMLESGAGVGLVLILRWYWWRINAWSEVTALVASAAGFAYLRLFTHIVFPDTLLYLVPWTTVCWLTVTLVTEPEPLEHLIAFYRRVRPGGPGWTRVARAAGRHPEPLGRLWLAWVAGCVMVYGTLFGVGSWIFDSLFVALPYFGAAALAGSFLYVELSRQAWNEIDPLPEPDRT